MQLTNGTKVEVLELNVVNTHPYAKVKVDTGAKGWILAVNLTRKRGKPGTTKPGTTKAESPPAASSNKIYPAETVPAAGDTGAGVAEAEPMEVQEVAAEG